MESHYTEVTEAVPSHAICMICEGVTGQGHRGQLVTVGRRPDNKAPLFAHQKCLPIANSTHGPSFDNLYRNNGQENIWAFASKFKYYANATNPESPESTVQETFPSVDMPKEQPAVETEVKQKSKDGAPVPPKPF